MRERIVLLARLVDQRERLQETIWRTALVLQRDGVPVDQLCQTLDCSTATFYTHTRPFRDGLGMD